VGNVDDDPEKEIVLGLGIYPGLGGYFEIRHGAAAGYRSKGWGNVGGPATFGTTGATFPAVGGLR
jgi:hypothetical protein